MKWILVAAVSVIYLVTLHNHYTGVSHPDWRGVCNYLDEVMDQGSPALVIDTRDTRWLMRYHLGEPDRLFYVDPLELVRVSDNFLFTRVRPEDADTLYLLYMIDKTYYRRFYPALKEELAKNYEMEVVYRGVQDGPIHTGTELDVFTIEVAKLKRRERLPSPAF